MAKLTAEQLRRAEAISRLKALIDAAKCGCYPEPASLRWQLDTAPKDVQDRALKALQDINPVIITDLLKLNERSAKLWPTAINGS